MEEYTEAKYIVAIVAIICITALEGAVILQKMDGAALGAAIGAIGTILGLVFGVTYKRASEKPE